MSREINPFGLRMPAELRARLEAAAEKDKRSLNAEIVMRLESSLAKTSPEPEYRVAEDSPAYDIPEQDLLAEVLQSVKEHERQLDLTLPSSTFARIVRHLLKIKKPSKADIIDLFKIRTENNDKGID